MRAYKIRIYPNQKQITQISKTFGCCRFLWNQTLSDFQKSYEENKTFSSRTLKQFKEKLSRLSETYARNFAKYVEKSCSDGRTWLSRKAARTAIYFGDNPLRTNHARDAKLDALLGR